MKKRQLCTSCVFGWSPAVYQSSVLWNDHLITKHIHEVFPPDFRGDCMTAFIDAVNDRLFYSSKRRRLRTLSKLTTEDEYLSLGSL